MELNFKLLAIVAVDPVHRVRCQQPGCGHGVYARIHVVEDAGELIVLGSDCFAKRYGEGHARGFQGFGAGGGRMLTQAEREMLLHNTAALLAQFELERRKEQELIESKLAALRELHALRSQHSGPRIATTPRLRGTPTATQDYKNFVDAESLAVASIPLPFWATLKKTNTSFFAYGMTGGNCWVLMQSATHSGCFIAPAPINFEGWDEALPPSLGRANLARGVYESDRDINSLVSWFASRNSKSSRIDSDARAIQHFAQNAANQ
jgi:hypothetical protein